MGFKNKSLGSGEGGKIQTLKEREKKTTSRRGKRDRSKRSREHASSLEEREGMPLKGSCRSNGWQLHPFWEKEKRSPQKKGALPRRRGSRSG